MARANEDFICQRGTEKPALFVGHGSPLNAIEDNEFSHAWIETGNALPQPRAILCVSAHWETRGTSVTAMEHPKTIHDFGGFPRALSEYQYPAPGSPELARLVQETVANEHYLPLLYILALQDPGESVRFFADRVTMDSLSMRSVWIG